MFKVKNMAVDDRPVIYSTRINGFRSVMLY